MVEDGSAPYYELAASFVAKAFGEDLFGDVPSSLCSDVNRALSDHLFLDRGYQLHPEFRIVLSIDQFTELMIPSREEAGYHPLLVRIFLRDDKMRRFGFEQIGSGLGYVLPVLCSIFNPRVNVCLLQQPELHLHPALQAAMGDVLIDGIQAKSPGGLKQIVVETHSEHLLLRILKRIRHTALGTRGSAERGLRPSDVSVVYFDPQIDGTSAVNHLRISNDGDFLDVWPRGFFAERDRELFDE